MGKRAMHRVLCRGHRILLRARGSEESMGGCASVDKEPHWNASSRSMTPGLWVLCARVVSVLFAAYVLHMRAVCVCLC